VNGWMDGWVASVEGEEETLSFRLNALIGCDDAKQVPISWMDPAMPSIHPSTQFDKVR